MEHEVMRLGTFANYPVDAAISSIILANEGFIYIGKGLSSDIKCFFCGVIFTNLNPAVDIKNVHATLSPKCSMINGDKCRNITWNKDITHNREEQENKNYRYFNGTFDGSNYIQDRALINQGNNSVLPVDVNASTVTNISHNPVSRDIFQAPVLEADSATTSNQTQQSLAYDSQYITPAIVSEVQNENSVFNHSTSTSQALATREAPLLQGNSIQNHTASTNQPNSSATFSNPIQTVKIPSNSSGGAGPSYSDLGIITERPKRPEFALKQKRRETFTNWPRDHHLSEDELAEAGFYYAGYGDCARCFYCGGGLRNWEDEDDVWVEHARWFPRCAYIRGKLGQNVIDVVQDLCKQFEQISIKMVIDKLGHPLLLNNCKSSLKRDAAVKSVVDLGYDEKNVLEIATLLKAESIQLGADVLLQRLQQEIKQTSVSTLSQAAGNNLENRKKYSGEATRKLKEKNNQLRQQTVCKICLDQDVAVVFLPCGHLVSCTECATAMKDCPLCRTNVKGIARAFMS